MNQNALKELSAAIGHWRAPAIGGDIPHGDMPGDKEDILEEQNKFIRRGEHAWLVEGLCSIDDFREHFHIEGELPGEKEAYFKTLGGFLTYLLGYIPKETEKVTYGRFTFEIVDCDNRRIDKVLVTEGTASAKE